MAQLSPCFCHWCQCPCYQYVFVRIELFNFCLSKLIRIARRVQGVRDWKRLPLVCWCKYLTKPLPATSVLTSRSQVVLLIYCDSIIFVVGTAILSNGFGVDSSQDICSKAVLLCLGCYMTTKVSTKLISG